MSGSLTNAQIVQGFYTNILGRVGNSVTEVAPWANVLTGGALTAAQVEAAFVASAEAQANVVPIVEIYQTETGHAPTLPQLTAAVALEGSQSLQQIATTIANSGPSQSFYGNPGTTLTAAFVTALYQTALGRLPDAGAVAGWLASGLTPAQLEFAFATSAEAVARDAPAVTNFLTTVGAVTDGSSPAYGATLFPLPTSIFTLTPGLDTATANQFNASETLFNFDGHGPTLNPGDSLTGQASATNNTLSITDLSANGNSDNLPSGVTLTNIQNVVLNSSGNTALSGFDTSGVVGVNTLAVTTAGSGPDVVKATNGVAGKGTAVTVTHNNSAVGGTVTVLGGNQVTATQNAAATVLVGLTSINTVPVAANLATSSINVTTNSTAAGDVDVAGGTTVSVTATGPSYTGGINIGNVATGNSLAGGPANPTGSVVVNDFGVGSLTTVFGGSTVTVNAAGANGTPAGGVIVGDATAKIPSNQRSGVGTVTDTSSVAFDGLTFTTGHNSTASNVSMYGGTDANVTTNAGAVTIGTDLSVAGTLTLPSGNVTVVDTANDGTNTVSATAGVTVYGGVNVSATAADANVLVGGAVSTKALPSGTVAVTETKATTQKDLAAAGVHTIGVDGGNGVTVAALGQTVTVGATFGTAGAQLVTQTGILTGAGLGLNSGAVTVDGGTTVGITTTGGTVTVGALIGAGYVVPTGAVTVTDTFGSGNATKDDISVLGGTTVNVTVGSADKGAITVGGTGAGVTLNAAGTALKNPTISPSGAVTIVDAQTNGATTTYGTGAVNVVTNGSPSVSIQGGKVGAIVDAQSTLATGGASPGKAVGANTLASVVLDGVQTGDAVALKSDALTSLTILDNNVASNAFTVTNNTAAHALTLTLGNDSSTLNKDGTTKVTNNFSVTDAIATSLIIGDSATPSNVAVQASTSTVALTAVKATSLTMNNTKAATLNLAGDNALTGITLTGAGNVTLLGVLATTPANQAFVFNASTASGNVTTDFNPTTTAGIAQTFIGGSGVDTVTTTSNAFGWGSGVALQGGSGTADVLVANYAAGGTDVALGSPSTTAIKGFEILGLGTAATGTYDASGFTGVTVGQVFGAVTISNAAKGASLSITAAPTGGAITFTGAAAATTGAADTLAINVGVDPAGTVLGTPGVATGTVTAHGYEAVTVNSLGKAFNATGAPSLNTMTLTDTPTTGTGTLAITGDTSLNLTAANTGFTAITDTDTATVNVNAVGLSNIGSTITGGTAALLATGSAGGTEVASIVLGGTGATPFAVADTVVVTLKSADGTTNLGTYTYTVAGSAASAATAAASLVAAINAGATTGATVLTGVGNNTAGVTAKASGGSIVLTGAAATPFQVQTAMTVHTGSGTATQTLLGGVQQELITVAGTPVVGDTLIVTINNVALPTVTLPAAPTAATAAIALALAITTANPAGIASAVAVGNAVLVTGSGGNAYTLTAAATGGSTVAAAETINYATVAENYVSGAGGATFTLGVGGSWNSTAHKYSSGSETVNLAASVAKSDSIIATVGAVSTFNGATGGISSFTVGSQAASDALTFATVGKTAATNVATTTVGTLAGASLMAAVLDPAGALATALGNMTFSISNGVITFGAVGGHNISEFNTAQFISAAEIIVNSTSNGGGANKVAAFSNGTDSFVVASDNGATLRGGADSADTLLQLRGLTSVSGFGSTFGAGVIVSTNVTNVSKANIGSSTATTTFNDTGFSLDTFTGASQTTAAAAIGVTTYNNLAASAELDINASSNNFIGSIVTSQVGPSGANSLTVQGSSNSYFINNLTVAGDALVVFNGVTNNLTYTVTKLVDSTNTMNTIKVIAGGGSALTDLAAIASTALTTIDLTAATGAVKLGDGAALSQASLTVKDTPLAGATDTVGIANINLSGANDVVTLGASATASNNNNNNTVTTSGAGNTITIDGKGANLITANGAGNTITVGDAIAGVGANTIVATGVGDNITFLGNQQAGIATATVGSGANVTFGTATAGTENIVVTGALTGATSAGSFAFVTLNNLVGNLGGGTTDTLKFNNFTGANTELFAADTFGHSMVNVASAGTLGQALDLAVSQAAISQSSGPNTAAFAKIAAGVGVLDWFQFGGNTYIAEANNTGTAAAAHTALGVSDAVVKISGLVDLSSSTFSGHTLTFAVASS